MFCISYRFLSDISLSDRIMLLTTCKALGITEVPLWAVIRLTKPGRSHTTTFNTESSTSIPNRICHSVLNYFVLFSICSLQLPMLYMIAHSVRHMALNAHKSSKNFNILKQHSLYWISAGGKCIVGIFFLPFPPFLYHFQDLGHAGGAMSLGWPGNALVFLRKSWMKSANYFLLNYIWFLFYFSHSLEYNAFSFIV